MVSVAVPSVAPLQEAVVVAISTLKSISTITSKVQELVFPDASDTLYSTIVVPAGKVDPLTKPATNSTSQAAQLSVAVGSA